MRDSKYDIAKGLAIYLVVMGHMLSQYGIEQFKIINFLHMPLFFFISGYFLHYTIFKYSFKEFIIRKLKTLFLPYFIWSFFSFAINIFFMILGGEGTNLEYKKEFLNIILYGRSVWFFIMLFFSSVFLAMFAYYAGTRFWKLWCMIVWLLISIQPVTEIFALYKFKWLFPFMFCGYIWAEYKEHIHVKVPCTWVNCIVSTMIYMLVLKVLYNPKCFTAYSNFQYHATSEIATGIIYYIISLCGIIICMSLSYKLLSCKIGKVFGYIGQGTADIYVTHMFLIKFLTLQVPFTNTKLCIFIVVYSFIIVLISLCTKYVLRKSKLYNFSLGRY